MNPLLFAFEELLQKVGPKAAALRREEAALSKIRPSFNFTAEPEPRQMDLFRAYRPEMPEQTALTQALGGGLPEEPRLPGFEGPGFAQPLLGAVGAQDVLRDGTVVPTGPSWREAMVRPSPLDNLPTMPTRQMDLDLFPPNMQTFPARVREPRPLGGLDVEDIPSYMRHYVGPGRVGAGDIPASAAQFDMNDAELNLRDYPDYPFTSALDGSEQVSRGLRRKRGDPIEGTGRRPIIAEDLTWKDRYADKTRKAAENPSGAMGRRVDYLAPEPIPYEGPLQFDTQGMEPFPLELAERRAELPTDVIPGLEHEQSAVTSAMGVLRNRMRQQQRDWPGHQVDDQLTPRRLKEIQAYVARLATGSRQEAQARELDWVPPVHKRDKLALQSLNTAADSLGIPFDEAVPATTKDRYKPNMKQDAIEEQKLAGVYRNRNRDEGLPRGEGWSQALTDGVDVADDEYARLRPGATGDKFTDIKSGRVTAELLPASTVKKLKIGGRYFIERNGEQIPLRVKAIRKLDAAAANADADAEARAERAAIMEHDGKLSPAEAEQQADQLYAPGPEEKGRLRGRIGDRVGAFMTGLHVKDFRRRVESAPKGDPLYLVEWQPFGKRAKAVEVGPKNSRSRREIEVNLPMAARDAQKEMEAVTESLGKPKRQVDAASQGGKLFSEAKAHWDSYKTKHPEEWKLAFEKQGVTELVPVLHDAHKNGMFRYAAYNPENGKGYIITIDPEKPNQRPHLSVANLSKILAALGKDPNKGSAMLKAQRIKLQDLMQKKGLK